MRSAALVSVLLSLPSVGLADACREEIAALMQGALDPFNRR